MDDYRRQPPERTPSEYPESSTDAALGNAVRLVRELLPFPSSADEGFQPMPLVQMGRQLMPPNVTPTEPVPVVATSAAPIVSRAAAILDEEMAKGVIAARGAAGSAHYQDTDQTSTVLRQVHDVIDNIARIWPSVQGASAQWPGASAAAPNDDPEALPTLKPAAVVQPGQRGTISMVLCNKEERSVRLMPMSTDLIGSTGTRISSRLVEFLPGEICLEPGEQKELQVRIAIPIESAVGCYVGLLVVTGLDYLRALITIDVG